MIYLPRDKWYLPDDLVAFLEAGRQLEYDPAQAAAGAITLKSLDQLEVREVYVMSRTPFDEDDPHAGQGYYVLPAIGLDVVDQPIFEEVSFWYPSYRQFGQWDEEHSTAIRFVGVTWSDIVKNPMRYLNEIWNGSYGTLLTTAPILPWQDESYELRPGDPFD